LHANEKKTTPKAGMLTRTCFRIKAMDFQAILKDASRLTANIPAQKVSKFQ